MCAPQSLPLQLTLPVMQQESRLLQDHHRHSHSMLFHRHSHSMSFHRHSRSIDMCFLLDWWVLLLSHGMMTRTSSLAAAELSGNPVLELTYWYSMHARMKPARRRTSKSFRLSPPLALSSLLAGEHPLPTSAAPIRC